MCQASFWPVFLGSKFPFGQHSPLSLFQNSHDLLSQQSAFDHCLLWLLSLMLSRAGFRCQTQCNSNAFCWVHVLNNNLGQRVLQLMPLDTYTHNTHNTSRQCGFCLCLRELPQTSPSVIIWENVKNFTPTYNQYAWKNTQMTWTNTLYLTTTIEKVIMYHIPYVSDVLVQNVYICRSGCYPPSKVWIHLTLCSKFGIDLWSKVN